MLVSIHLGALRLFLDTSRAKPALVLPGMGMCASTDVPVCVSARVRPFMRACGKRHRGGERGVYVLCVLCVVWWCVVCGVICVVCIVCV